MSFVPVFVDFCSKLFLDKTCNAFFGNMNLNIIDIYDRKTIIYQGGLSRVFDEGEAS